MTYRPNPLRPYPKTSTPLKKAKPLPPKKVTGEGVMFRTIWNTRPHVSFLSGEKLGNDAYPWMFAHVLPKKKYPDFRLRLENIVLLTWEEHDRWDKAPRSTLVEPFWKKLFDLEAKLKAEYEKKQSK
jgi:hypothetical protein